MNKTSVVSTIMGILGYIFGVLYSFTLILIPVAVYCFIGAKFYMDSSSLTESQMVMKKRAFVGYAIFFSIVAFPFGLISIIPAYVVSHQNVTITSLEDEPQRESTSAEETIVEKKEVSENTTTDEETIEKLEHLKSEGLITEEEFERAKSEVLNKKK